MLRRDSCCIFQFILAKGLPQKYRGSLLSQAPNLIARTLLQQNPGGEWVRMPGLVTKNAIDLDD